LKLIRVPISLAGIVRSTLQTLAGEIEAAGVRVEEDFEEDLPSVRIDGESMKQVLINLVKNGLQAMEASEKKVLRIALARREERVIRLTVSDTGGGIPEENGEKLFHPFFSTKTNGTGLGLAVCKKIVEAHGGAIEMESIVGEGASFRFDLPLAAESGRPDGQDSMAELRNPDGSGDAS
ncbi:MAG: sensor histidine kinase, partial [Planctomycetota bacterium]|jgi:two-component system sensor kinase FixL